MAIIDWGRCNQEWSLLHLPQPMIAKGERGESQREGESQVHGRDGKFHIWMLTNQHQLFGCRCLVGYLWCDSVLCYYRCEWLSHCDLLATGCPLWPFLDIAGLQIMYRSSFFLLLLLWCRAYAWMIHGTLQIVCVCFLNIRNFYKCIQGPFIKKSHV